MKMKRTSLTALLALILSLLSFQKAEAQYVSLGTNLIQIANLGTINAEVGVTINRHVTLTLGARYNNWSFRGEDGDPLQILNRKRTLSMGARYWYWNTFSGWYTCVKAQCQEYNRNIFTGHVKEQGIAWGGVIGCGYALMLSPHLNLEFGISGWLGSRDWATYSKATYGHLLDSGRGFFFLPDDVSITLSVIF